MNQKLDDWMNLWISTAIKKCDAISVRRCGDRRAKTHLKFTLTSRCVGSCLQNFKSTNQCPLWNTTIIFRTQQSFAGHNNHFRNTTQYCDSENKQNEVSRNTKTTTNKQSNEFASLNSSYFQMEETDYSVDITSNNWHNKSSKFRILCIGLAITCATLLAAGKSEALTIGHWSGLIFTGKKLGSLSKHDVDGSVNIIWKRNFALLQYVFNYSKSLCLKNGF